MTIALSKNEANTNTSAPNLELPEYLIRMHVDVDLPLIHSSWGAAAYKAEPNCLVPYDLFFPEQKAHIDYCLNHYQTYILHHPDDWNEVMGFVNYSFFNQSLIIHWLYVKNMYRKRKLGNSLVPSILNDIEPAWASHPIVCSQYSEYFKALQPKYRLILDPYYVQRERQSMEVVIPITMPLVAPRMPQDASLEPQAPPIPKFDSKAFLDEYEQKSEAAQMKAAQADRDNR